MHENGIPEVTAQALSASLLDGKEIPVCQLESDPTEDVLSLSMTAEIDKLEKIKLINRNFLIKWVIKFKNFFIYLSYNNSTTKIMKN